MHAHGVVVVVNAGEFTVKSQPIGASGVPRMQVARWLTRHGEVLDPSQVEALYEVARRSTTWRS